MKKHLRKKHNEIENKCLFFYCADFFRRSGESEVLSVWILPWKCILVILSLVRTSNPRRTQDCTNGGPLKESIQLIMMCLGCLIYTHLGDCKFKIACLIIRYVLFSLYTTIPFFGHCKDIYRCKQETPDAASTHGAPKLHTVILEKNLSQRNLASKSILIEPTTCRFRQMSHHPDTKRPSSLSDNLPDHLLSSCLDGLHARFETTSPLGSTHWCEFLISNLPNKNDLSLNVIILEGITARLCNFICLDLITYYIYRSTVYIFK